MSQSLSAIVLGVGTPNLCSSGDKTMCAILLGDQGLFRVYPIPGEEKFPVWSKVEVKLERSSSDPREESWKLISYRVTKTITNASLKRSILDRCVLSSGLSDPLEYQNENRRSIFIVKPNALGGVIQPRDAVPDEDWVHTQSNAWAKPFVTWQSDQGKEHKSHLLSREAYETIRRNPHSPFDLFRNLNIGSPDWDFWLVMGNLKHRRNVWGCVHVHRLKKTSGLSTMLFCDPINGKPEDWPYSKQEDGNAPVAGDQLLMFTTEDM